MNNKGITLISLVIYIAIIFVVLATLMRITTYFSRNIRDSADVSFETEFNKLNLYLIDETESVGNIIVEITNGTQVIFSSGNKYTYNAEDKKVYLNDNIKICQNIDNCLFEQKVAENGKNVLALTIKINGIEKNVNYVITTQGKSGLQLPYEYQQVEYIESTGTQYIDTGINGGNSMAFYIKLNTLGGSAVNYEQYFAGDLHPKGVKLYCSTNSSDIAIQSGSSGDTKADSQNDANIHTIKFTTDGTAIVDDMIVDVQITNDRMGRTYILCV